MAINKQAFLYFEDDLSSRQIMEVLLKDVMGFSMVFIYEDSTHFQERLNALPVIPAVIFLDIHIKPLDGYEMIRIIREQPKFAHTKVVALTASVMSNEVEYLRNAGFDSLVGKPINPAAFPTMLQTILTGESIWSITWE